MATAAWTALGFVLWAAAYLSDRIGIPPWVGTVLFAAALACFGVAFARTV